MTVTDYGDIILLHHWTLIVIPIVICDNIWHLPWQGYDIVMYYQALPPAVFPYSCIMGCAVVILSSDCVACGISGAMPDFE